MCPTCTLRSLFACFGAAKQWKVWLHRVSIVLESRCCIMTQTCYCYKIQFHSTVLKRFNLKPFSSPRLEPWICCDWCSGLPWCAAAAELGPGWCCKSLARGKWGVPVSRWCWTERPWHLTLPGLWLVLIHIGFCRVLHRERCAGYVPSEA